MDLPYNVTVSNRKTGETVSTPIPAPDGAHALASVLFPSDSKAQMTWIQNHPVACTWAVPNGMHYEAWLQEEK